MSNDVILLSAESGNNNTIKLSDSNAWVYSELAKDYANNVQTNLSVIQQIKNNIESEVTSVQDAIEFLSNLENIQANAEVLYNRLYFGEYYDENTGEWIVYKKEEYDENNNLLNHYYRLQEGVDENNNPIFVLDENDDYVLQECTLYKINQLYQKGNIELIDWTVEE